MWRKKEMKFVIWLALFLVSLVFVGSTYADESTKPKYIGGWKCHRCHKIEYDGWNERSNKERTMSHTVHVGSILITGTAFKFKIQNNLDPHKDYSRDKKCLKCHTTGYGKPDGYQLEDLPQFKKRPRKLPPHNRRLGSIDCEACHGPGSEYIKICRKAAVMVSGDLVRAMNDPWNKKLRSDTRRSAGMIDPINSCKKCHHKSTAHKIKRLRVKTLQNPWEKYKSTYYKKKPSSARRLIDFDLEYGVGWFPRSPYIKDLNGGIHKHRAYIRWKAYSWIWFDTDKKIIKEKRKKRIADKKKKDKKKKDKKKKDKKKKKSKKRKKKSTGRKGRPKRS